MADLRRKGIRKAFLNTLVDIRHMSLSSEKMISRSTALIFDHRESQRGHTVLIKCKNASCSAKKCEEKELKLRWGSFPQ